MDDWHIVSAHVMGHTLPAVTTTVTPRRTMAYAAGIGAMRPIYFDDVPVAPPAFCVALEWQVLNGEPYRVLLGATQAVMERAIHVGQHSVFRAPIQAGMSVVTEGRIAGLRETEKGLLIAVALSTREPRSGSMLVSSRFTALLLRARLAGGAHWPEWPLAPDRVRPEWTQSLTPSPLTSHCYGECAEIWNPIHTEGPAARAAGLAAPILHGTWSWAVSMEAAIDHAAKGEPRHLKSWSGRFLHPVSAGKKLELIGQYQSGEVRMAMVQGGDPCVMAHGEVEVA